MSTMPPNTWSYTDYFLNFAVLLGIVMFAFDQYFDFILSKKKKRGNNTNKDGRTPFFYIVGLFVVAVVTYEYGGCYVCSFNDVVGKITGSNVSLLDSFGGAPSDVGSNIPVAPEVDAVPEQVVEQIPEKVVEKQHQQQQQQQHKQQVPEVPNTVPVQKKPVGEEVPVRHIPTKKLQDTQERIRQREHKPQTTDKRTVARQRKRQPRREAEVREVEV